MRNIPPDTGAAALAWVWKTISTARRCAAAAATVLGCMALAPIALATPPLQHQIPDTMGQRVLACTGCHGSEGRASPDGYRPRIAGKPADYLYNQLRNFREGRRTNAAMVGLLDQMTDTYLREIADHFSAIELPYPAPQKNVAAPPVLERGKSLALQGNPAQKIPACAQCHGERLTGTLPAVPGLLGLPRDYLLAQLGAWKTGQRRATSPDCMQRIASQLSTDDASAIATWLSTQAVPADPRATTARREAAPMRCGSGLP